jgi:serine/threonine protein kinase
MLPAAIIKFYKIKTYEHQGHSTTIIVMELIKGISLDTFLQHPPSINLQPFQFMLLLHGFTDFHPPSSL